MKKMVCLIVAAMLLLLSVTALADVTPGQVVGTWYMKSRDEKIVLRDYHLDLNRDKSAILVMDDVENEYTWSLSGDRVVLGTEEDKYAISMEYTEDGELKFLNQDFSEENARLYTFIFGREEIKIDLPEVKTAEKEEDFYGDYVYAYTVTGKIYEQAETEVTANIDFAQITITVGENTIVCLTDFQDGKLIVNEKKVNAQYPNMVVELTELDDTLKATFMNESGDVGQEVYFRTAQPAQTVQEVQTEPAA